MTEALVNPGDLSDLDAALAGQPIQPPTLTGAKGKPARRRHKHEWCRNCPEQPVITHCTVTGCALLRDDPRIRRGRLNRTRGNSIEREVCALLGIPRVGQYGGPEDGGKSDSWLVVQVKSGGAYPERIDMLLRSLPVTAAQLRAVVHTDTPGPGKRRRMLVTLDLKEFADWFGAVREAKP